MRQICTVSSRIMYRDINSDQLRWSSDSIEIFHPDESVEIELSINHGAAKLGSWRGDRSRSSVCPESSQESCKTFILSLFSFLCLSSSLNHLCLLESHSFRLCNSDSVKLVPAALQRSRNLLCSVSCFLVFFTFSFRLCSFILQPNFYLSGPNFRIGSCSIVSSTDSAGWNLNMIRGLSGIRCRRGSKADLCWVICSSSSFASFTAFACTSAHIASLATVGLLQIFVQEIDFKDLVWME